MSASCDDVNIYTDFKRTACKVYISINSNLLSYKNWKEN